MTVEPVVELPTEPGSGPAVGPVPCGPYRYGAHFVDRTTGLRFEAHHPVLRPDRWAAYLDGAAREYARFGLAGLVDRETLTAAEDVSLFFVGLDPEGRVVAGVRCHGPLDDVDASQALVEMASSREADELRDTVRSTVPHGVVEIKGAWREGNRDEAHLVAATLGRCAVHALHWVGAEVALGAVAERLKPTSRVTGAEMIGTESAAYPSDEYRTILMGWHRATGRPVARPDQRVLLREEGEQLLAGPRPGPDGSWRPIALDARRRADRQLLFNLRADPAVVVLDVVDRQRQELRRLLPAPTADLLDQPPRHVYYPWRQTVVGMAGPDVFSVLRLDRNRNKITAAEQARLRSLRIGIVGLSAGHSIAATLVLGGLCGELRLADFDEVELTNLNRIPASVLDVGCNKAVLAARRVAEIDPYLPVRVVPDGVDEDNLEDFVAGLDVLVEECDSIDMKLLVREVARRHQVPVIMETSDRGLLDVERFDLEPTRPILHDLLPGVTAGMLAELPLPLKVPYVLDIVDASQSSARGAASMAELGRTLSTWPQLAGDITLGGATVAAAVRRLGLGEPLPSGRVRIDLDALVASLEPPPPKPTRAPVDLPPAATVPTTSDPLVVMAHAATLAPSGGNAQPWRLKTGPRQLTIELDRQRTSTMDVRSRGSYVAIGAAVFNARTAAAAVGRLGPVALFPADAGPDAVASLVLGDGTDAELAAFYPDVLRREANRRRGVPEPLDLSLAAQLADAVAAEGGHLRLVTDHHQLTECSDILGDSERIRFLTAHLHREMIGELRWPGDDVRTGIDLRTLELSPPEVAVLGVARRGDVMDLLRDWDAGQALGDNARGAVRASSALAVVTVPNASPTAYVQGGAAVERLWITAQQAELGVQPVSPVFVFAVQDADFDTLGGERWGDDLRTLSQRFRRTLALAPTDAIALVLRLSHVPPASVRSQRLPLDEVLTRVPPVG